jgi:hypothetical protein
LAWILSHCLNYGLSIEKLKIEEYPFGNCDLNPQKVHICITVLEAEKGV